MLKEKKDRPYLECRGDAWLVMKGWILSRMLLERKKDRPYGPYLIKEMLDW